MITMKIAHFAQNTQRRCFFLLLGCAFFFAISGLIHVVLNEHEDAHGHTCLCPIHSGGKFEQAPGPDLPLGQSIAAGKPSTRQFSVIFIDHSLTLPLRRGPPSISS